MYADLSQSHIVGVHQLFLKKKTHDKYRFAAHRDLIVARNRHDSKIIRTAFDRVKTLNE